MRRYTERQSQNAVKEIAECNRRILENQRWETANTEALLLPEMIYFISEVDGDRVKIGHSRSVNGGRLRTIYKSSAATRKTWIYALFRGPAKVETTIHRRYENFRIELNGQDECFHFDRSIVSDIHDGYTDLGMKRISVPPDERRFAAPMDWNFTDDANAGALSSAHG